MKRSTSLLAVSALVLGGLAVTTPAEAANECTGTSQTKFVSVGAEPPTMVLGTKLSRDLTFYNQVEDPCTASVSSSASMENSPLGDDMHQVDRVGNVASFQVTYQIDPRDLANTDAGSWQVDLTASGTTVDHSVVSFTLLRATRLTTNAGPEPVQKGKRITVQGLLTRANWDTHSYRGMRHAPVVVLARRPPDKTYVPLRTVTTDAKGRLKVGFEATQEICFRFAYAGSATTAPITSSGDCVELV